MRKFMVANPKGGCGKSTMAIHLASWFARCDEVVYPVSYTHLPLPTNREV